MMRYLDFIVVVAVGGEQALCGEYVALSVDELEERRFILGEVRDAADGEFSVAGRDGGQMEGAVAYRGGRAGRVEGFAVVVGVGAHAGRTATISILGGEECVLAGGRAFGAAQGVYGAGVGIVAGAWTSAGLTRGDRRIAELIGFQNAVAANRHCAAARAAA